MLCCPWTLESNIEGVFVSQASCSKRDRLSRRSFEMNIVDGSMPIDSSCSDDRVDESIPSQKHGTAHSGDRSGDSRSTKASGEELAMLPLPRAR